MSSEVDPAALIPGAGLSTGSIGPVRLPHSGGMEQCGTLAHGRLVLVPCASHGPRRRDSRCSISKRQRARSAGHFSGACSTTQRHQTWSRSEAEHVVAAHAGHEALLEVERVVLADRAPTRARVSRAGRRVDGLPAPGSPAGGAGSPRRGRPPRRAPRARCARSAGDLRAAHAGLRSRGRR